MLTDLLLSENSPQSVAEAEELFSRSVGKSELNDRQKRIKARILMLQANHTENGLQNGETLDPLERQAAITLLTSVSRIRTADDLMIAEILIAEAKFSAAAKRILRTISAAEIEVEPLIAFLKKHLQLPEKERVLKPPFEQALLRIESTAGHEMASLELRIQKLQANSKIDPQNLENITSLTVDQFTQRCLQNFSESERQMEFIHSLFDYLVKNERIQDAARLTKMAPPAGNPT